jgi:diguanylate cyclase (GGDEF)-like protein
VDQRRTLSFLCAIVASSLAAWTGVMAGMQASLPILASAAIGLGCGMAIPGLIVGLQRIRQPPLVERRARRKTELLEQQLQRYPRLLEACMALAGSNDRDQVARILAEQSLSLAMGARGAAVLLQEPDGRILARAQAGEPVRHQQQDLVFVSSEARSLLRRSQDHLLVLLPLRAESRAEAGLNSGVLAIELSAEPELEDYNQELLGALARLGGIALATTELLSEARALAQHDDLTKLFGQHEFLRRLREHHAAALRNGSSLSVLMCDMDHLKDLNDRHGHLAGDACLQAVAEVIRSCIPDGAVACRYGGEEFACCLPMVDGAAAVEIAEEIRARIASLRPLVDAPQQELTASLGVAALHGEHQAEALLERADQACYRAKEAGRNRVEAAP